MDTCMCVCVWGGGYCMNAQVKIIPSYPTQMFYNYRLMCALFGCCHWQLPPPPLHFPLGQSDWLGVGEGKKSHSLCSWSTALACYQKHQVEPGLATSCNYRSYRTVCEMTALHLCARQFFSLVLIGAVFIKGVPVWPRVRWECPSFFKWCGSRWAVLVWTSSREDSI